MVNWSMVMHPTTGQPLPAIQHGKVVMRSHRPHTFLLMYILVLEAERRRVKLNSISRGPGDGGRGRKVKRDIRLHMCFKRISRA